MPTPSFSGFSQLRTPKDLLQKLRYDLARLADEPGNTYAAFDFFVTAEHMVDWVHPTSKADREALRDIPLLAVVSHIANGAKHFVATAKHHKSVESIEMDTYAEDYVEPDYFAESILVRLTASEATALGSPTFEATVLAYRVYEYWRDHLGEQSGALRCNDQKDSSESEGRSTAVGTTLEDERKAFVAERLFDLATLELSASSLIPGREAQGHRQLLASADDAEGMARLARPLTGQ